MLLEYYTKIIQPYVKQLNKIFASKIRIPLSFIIFLTGLVLTIIPRKFRSLFIFQHTSVTITTIAWFILSQKEHSNSSHFLYGSICAQITYFVTVKKITRNRFTFFLILSLFYLPLICSKYGNDMIYLTLCTISLCFCVYKVDLFIVFVICFSGGCVTSGIACFWIKKEIICYEAILSAFILCLFGTILNCAMRKTNKKIYIERLDIDKAEVIEK